MLAWASQLMFYAKKKFFPVMSRIVDDYKVPINNRDNSGFFMSLDLYLGNMLTYGSSVDDDYLQNASAILDKLKSFYRQGGESSNLSKLLQDYTQVLPSNCIYSLAFQ